MTLVGRVRAESAASSIARVGEDTPLDLSAYPASTHEQIAQRLISADFRAWAQTAARVGHCAKPIRLVGRSMRIDKSTGEVLSTYSSSEEPLGQTFTRCGNRRESECPSCSRLYAADMFHLIRAGVAGGKGVPARVSDNPLVFATLTAPSFGHVHGTRNGRRCRPWAKGRRCEHGRPLTCHQVHEDGDGLLGQPLCCECYDYASQIVWQWWAPELWRRFTINLRRAVARTLGVSPPLLPRHATVHYAKVAEYQARGVVHLHALIRLDGLRSNEGFEPAPTGFDAVRLAKLIRDAAATVRYTAPPLHADDTARVLSFGTQTDARPVRVSRRPDDPDQALAPEQVAGYLAKYATKSATDTAFEAGRNPHLSRLRATVRDCADRALVLAEHQDHVACADPAGQPYLLLGKWVHMLGFRGHFATKSRRYSVTLGQLRRARHRAQVLIAASRQTGVPVDPAALEADLLRDEEEETTLVVGHWRFVKAGWDTAGDEALARAAAARAREYAQHKVQMKRAERQGPQRDSIGRGTS